MIRFAERLAAVSLVLLFGVLAYWAYAYTYGVNVQSIGDASTFRLVSTAVGHTELAWVVEQHHVALWFAKDGTGRLVPLLRRENPVAAILDVSVTNQQLETLNTRWLPGAWVIRSTGRWPDGTITIRFVFVPIWWLVTLTGAVPACFAVRDSSRHIRRFLRVGRIARVRRSRAQLGRCACGYDLRNNTSRRCPECGRRFRVLPVPWPVLSRR